MNASDRRIEERLRALRAATAEDLESVAESPEWLALRDQITAVPRRAQDARAIARRGGIVTKLARARRPWRRRSKGFALIAAFIAIGGAGAAIALNDGPDREQIAALARELATIEASGDCIPRERLAERVQEVLRDQGWEGWTTTFAARDAGEGGLPLPCGEVFEPNGLALGAEDLPETQLERFLSLDFDDRTVMLHAGLPRSVEEAFLAKGGLEDRLFRLSAERCFTPAELRREVDDLVADAGRTVVGFSVEEPPLPSWDDRTESSGAIKIAGERGRLLDAGAGCAVVVAADPATDLHNVVVEAWQRH